MSLSSEGHQFSAAQYTALKQDITALAGVLESAIPGQIDKVLRDYTKGTSGSATALRQAMPQLKEVLESFYRGLFLTPWTDGLGERIEATAAALVASGIEEGTRADLLAAIRAGLVLSVLDGRGKSSDRGTLLVTMEKLLSLGEQALSLAEVKGRAAVDDREGARQLLDVVIEMTIQINNVAYANTRILGEIRAVSSRADKVYSLTEEVMRSIEQVATNAVDADSQSQEASRAAQQGEAVVDGARSAMSAIDQTVRDVEARVEALQDENEKINATSSAIDAIAKKTNLLALNATIEAARAGDAGKGFAVVAGEVKDLSRQTAEATQGIASRIEALKSEMASITGKMDETTAAVTQGQETMEDVSQQIQAIASFSNDTSSRMSSIAALLDQQKNAVEEVTQDSHLIARSTTANLDALQKNLDDMRAVDSALGQQLRLMSAEDIPFKDIKIAQADHAMWKKRFADMVIGAKSMPREEVSNPAHTRFGKWLNDAKGKYAGYESVHAIDAPLNKVHRLAAETLDLMEKGNLEEAFANLNAVDSSSAEVQNCMTRLLDEVKAG